MKSLHPLAIPVEITPLVLSYLDYPELPVLRATYPWLFHPLLIRIYGFSKRMGLTQRLPVRDTIGTSVYFMTYESIKQLIVKYLVAGLLNVSLSDLENSLIGSTHQRKCFSSSESNV